AALLETRRVGIARFYLRTRPLLAALLPSQKILSLEVMRELDELRDPDALEVAPGKATAGEIKMARTLIESMSDTWDPTEHPNTYRKALEKLVASKRTFAVGEPERTERPAKVVDLMDALRKSLGQERARGRGKATTRRRGAA